MWLKLLSFAVLVGLTWRILGFVYFLGPHRTIHKHWPGPCRNVPPITSGAEGIAVSSQGLAFMSSGYKTPDTTDERIKNARGQIFLFDFNKSDDDAIPLNVVGDVTLEVPHGISLWEEEDTRSILIFVIDHEAPEDAVKIFRFVRPGSLQHIRTITDSAFMNTNDVVATSEVSFYVTNIDSGGTLAFVKMLLQIPTGNVVYYDGERGVPVTDHGMFLNGIATSHDGNYVYVSYMVDEAVAVFRREPNKRLTRIQTIPVSAIPDNLFYDANTGDLYASCGIPIGFFTMIHNYDHKASSHLLYASDRVTVLMTPLSSPTTLLKYSPMKATFFRCRPVQRFTEIDCSSVASWRKLPTARCDTSMTKFVV